MQTQLIPHRKHIFKLIKFIWLKLFEEALAVYCENYTDALCGQNAEF
jgi:hypothetical protein